MKKMKMVMMNGGLGNQLYQYAFARLMEISTKEKFIFDDSWAWTDNVEHNGYELERVFGLKLNLLSNYFTEDVWAEMVRLRMERVGIPQQLKNNGVHMTLMAEFSDHLPFDGNIVYMPPNSVADEVLYTYANAKGDIYYHGYWCLPQLVNKIKDTLQKELVFPEMDTVPGLPEINKEYATRIQSTDSVAMHIRRGDFLKYGRALAPDQYARAVAKMEERFPNATYFVFSDDIAWCQENKEELGLTGVKEVVYITGNTGNKLNYVDMQLMSMCKKMIISNSSFGIWAYYLNKTLGVEALMADWV